MHPHGAQNIPRLPRIQTGDQAGPLHVVTDLHRPRLPRSPFPVYDSTTAVTALARDKITGSEDRTDIQTESRIGIRRHADVGGDQFADDGVG